MTDLQPQPLWEVTTRDADQTEALGRRLGSQCVGGEVILLDGPLGAGKTCLAGGFARGLGIEQPAVSPTFMLMRSYQGSQGLTLHHLDFYRLEGRNDVATIGLEDCFSDQSVVLVEWPGSCPEAFADFTLALRIEITGPDERRIRALPGGLPLAEGLRISPSQPPHS